MYNKITRFQNATKICCNRLSHRIFIHFKLHDRLEILFGQSSLATEILVKPAVVLKKNSAWMFNIVVTKLPAYQ